jgi:hypothetical protein
MSTYGPVPPTPGTNRTVWSKTNGWYKICVTALSGYAVYIVVILARISMSRPPIEPVNRQFNAIVLTGLSLIAIMTFLLGWRLDLRDRDRARDARDEAWKESVYAAIRVRQGSAVGHASPTTCSAAGTDGPTLPIIYPAPAVAASASAIAERVADRIMACVDQRIDQRLDDIEQLAANEQSVQAMKGHNGRSVAPFPPRART